MINRSFSPPTPTSHQRTIEHSLNHNTHTRRICTISPSVSLNSLDRSVRAHSFAHILALQIPPPAASQSHNVMNSNRENMHASSCKHRITTNTLGECLVHTHKPIKVCGYTVKVFPYTRTHCAWWWFRGLCQMMQKLKSSSMLFIHSFHSILVGLQSQQHACLSAAADALAGCCGWFGLCKLNRQTAVSVCFNIVSGGSMVSVGGVGGGNRGGKSIPRIIILTLCPVHPPTQCHPCEICAIAICLFVDKRY